MIQHLLEHHGSESLRRHSQIDISTHNLFLFLSYMWAVTSVCRQWSSVQFGVYFFFFFCTANFFPFISIGGVLYKVCFSKGLVLQPFLPGEPSG